MFKKQLYFLFSLCIINTICNAQIMLSPKVIATNGGLAIGGSILLSYTIGEPVTSTFQSDTLKLTQGFQQVYPAFISLSIKQNNIASSEVSLYPNPATTIITIKSNKKISTIIINNAIGQDEFYKTGINTEKLDVNIAYLKAGVYLVCITDEQGLRTVKQIVKSEL